MGMLPSTLRACHTPWCAERCVHGQDEAMGTGDPKGDWSGRTDGEEARGAAMEGGKVGGWGGVGGEGTRRRQLGRKLCVLGTAVLPCM